MSSSRSTVTVRQTARVSQARTDKSTQITQNVAAELQAKKLRIRTNDRRIKAKAAQQRLKDEIKAVPIAQYREQARHIDEDSNEASDENSDEDSDEGSKRI